MAIGQDSEKVPATVAPQPMTSNKGGDNSNTLEQVPTNNARPACFSSTIQEVLFVLTATMAIAMGALLTGSVTVVSSFIGRDLAMTTAQITWISSATSLSSGALLLFFGKVADLFGRKAMFVVSLFLFSVFVLAAGFAKTPISLNVLCGVLGIFSASAVPPAVGILGVAYGKPSKRKNGAFACFSSGNPLGYVFGTIFGGLAADLFSWRASFYLIAIVFLCFTLVGYFTIPADWTEKEPLSRTAVKRFDLLGTGLTIAGIGMFSAALSLGATAEQGWSTSYVLALLIVGVALMVGFVFWENFYQYPLVPMGIWKDRNFSVSLAILMLGFMAFTPGSFFIGLYFQDVWGMSPLQVAVRLLPMAISGLIINVVAALILHRVSNKLLMYIGTAAYLFAFLLLSLNRVDSSYWAFCFPSFCLMVVGADLQFNVCNMYVMSSMPAHQQSIAGGIFQTVSKLCVSLGFGLATAIFNSVQASSTAMAETDFWDRQTRPYAAIFWFSTACSVFGLCLVPFLTIGTQGGKEKERRVDSASPTADARPEEKPNR